nr:glycosyltransferase family 39 protein [Anaerolineae bacterium]
MAISQEESILSVNETPSGPIRHWGWYLPLSVLLLLAAAFFRTWNLEATPPGLHSDELINAQISSWVQDGNISVIYDEAYPPREGFYHVLLALTHTILGRGVILWRLPSAWIALLTLSLTAHLMKRLYGVRTAMMALGLASVAFWPVWLGRTIQPITLLPLAVVFSIYTLVRAFEATELTESSLWFTVGGVILGITQYIHVSAWSMLLLYLVFILYHFLVDRRGLARHRGNIFYALALAVVIMLPLIMYIIKHPGVRDSWAAAGPGALLPSIPGRLVAVVGSLFLQGDMNAVHNIPGRPVFGPLLGILMIIGLGISLARWRQRPYGLVLLWLFIGLLSSVIHAQQPDFEYMAVVLPIMFALPAIGLRSIFGWVRASTGKPLQGILVWLVGIGVSLSIIGTAVWTFIDFFLVWPYLEPVQAAYQSEIGALARYLDAAEDPSPISICSVPTERDSSPFSLTNKDLLSYFMHRSTLPIRYFDCSQSLVLADNGNSQRLIFPRGQYYDYLPGSLVAWMYHASNEDIPGVPPDQIMRIDVSGIIDDYIYAGASSARASWPPEASASGNIDLPAHFGYNILFMGYEIRDDSLSPGAWLELVTYWQVDGPPPQNLTIFAHLLGNPVVIIAQRDSAGVQSGSLHDGDIFIQYSLIQTPGRAIPGDYPLAVGLYLDQPDNRLPVFTESGVTANRILLRGITIRRQ